MRNCARKKVIHTDCFRSLCYSCRVFLAFFPTFHQLPRGAVCLLLALGILAGRTAHAQAGGLPPAPAPQSQPLTLNPAAQAPTQQAPSIEQAKALLAQKQWSAAETLLRGVVRDHPDSVDGQYLLAYALFHEGNARESLGVYTTAARLRKPDADELMAVAADYVLLNDSVDAERWFTRATEMAPQNALAWYDLGRVRFSVNQNAGAQEAFERCLSLEPRNIRAEDNLGLVFEALHQPVQAEAAYRSAIAWQGALPSYSLAFLNLGSLLVSQGKADEGLPYLRQAIALAPENPKAHEALAKVLEQKGDLPGAQAELETAVKLAPASSSLHFLLGRLYSRQGLKEKAQQEFQSTNTLQRQQIPSAVPDVEQPR